MRQPENASKGKCGVQFALTPSRFENRTHLPVIELQRAA
jgi:hypothetical protein